MPIENEMRRVKVLKITSYLLLLAGVLLVIPYPTFHILKIILRALGTRSFSLEKEFMMFLIVGHLVLCVPLFSIPISALWVWRQTDSHDEKFYVFTRGFVRYSPALFLGLIEVFYAAKTGNSYIPGVFGAPLILYACILLKIDSNGGSVKTR